MISFGVGKGRPEEQDQEGSELGCGSARSCPRPSLWGNPSSKVASLCGVALYTSRLVGECGCFLPDGQALFLVLRGKVFHQRKEQRGALAEAGGGMWRRWPCSAERRTACVAVWHAQSPHTGTSETTEHSKMPDKNSRSVILTGLDIKTRGVEKVESVLWKLEGTHKCSFFKMWLEFDKMCPWVQQWHKLWGNQLLSDRI